MEHKRLTLADAARWCGGIVAPEYAERTFAGANFDTRRLQAGELFVAITGARDGHSFAADAMQKGAAAVLASKPLSPEIPAIYVENTVEALQAIAREYRRQLSCKCIGITGSVGKTTTKEMIAAVLETTFRTQKTAANFNNGLGLPVTVLGIAQDCEMAVLEMGMNHFGEIAALTRVAQPDFAVITNIGTMHIENLGSQEGILQAKLEILEGLRPGGTAVFNGEDRLLRSAAADCHALRFGMSPDCEVQAKEVRTEEDGVRFTVSAFGTEFPVALPVRGEHHVIDALAAVAVGLRCGVLPEKIQAGLRSFQNTGMRQKVYSVHGMKVIEDCYNAGPESMRAALRVLADTKTEGKRIAVLGGMLELGEFAPEAHRIAGAEAAEAAEILFAYGAYGDCYVQGARAAGMKAAECFPTHEALAAALQAAAHEGDTLLFKGSRGMRMERAMQLFLDAAENKG